MSRRTVSNREEGESIQLALLCIVTGLDTLVSPVDCLSIERGDLRLVHIKQGGLD